MAEHICKPVAHPELRPELVHITKTGGTTLEIVGAMYNFTWGACHWLEKVDDMGSLRCPEVNGAKPPTLLHSIWHVPPKWLDSASKFWLKNTTLFTVVRNPYERAVSSWNYLHSHTTVGVNDTAMNIWLDKTITTMYENRPVGSSRPKAIYFDNHVIPQTDYITKDVHVLRIETLERDFLCMMRGHGYDWVWPKKEFNKSKRPDRLTVANLTSTTKSLIAKAYREDFEQLGYPYHHLEESVNQDERSSEHGLG